MPPEGEMARPPAAPPVAKSPAEEDIRQRELTHEPFQPWCKACVQFRARQDKHPEHAHSGTSKSTVSFDFGYFSRETDEKDRLTCLFLRDHHTKACYAIPTERKGGPSLTCMVTEAARFIVRLGHRSVKLRCDNENAITAVKNSLQKVLRGLGIEAIKDTVPIDSHQSNGPVEQTVEIVGQHAAVLMHDLERGCGAEEGQVLFSTRHLRAIAHACWVRNRFTVSHGKNTACGSHRRVLCRHGVSLWRASSGLPTPGAEECAEMDAWSVVGKDRNK